MGKRPKEEKTGGEKTKREKDLEPYILVMFTRERPFLCFEKKILLDVDDSRMNIVCKNRQLYMLLFEKILRIFVRGILAE